MRTASIVLTTALLLAAFTSEGVAGRGGKPRAVRPGTRTMLRAASDEAIRMLPGEKRTYAHNGLQVTRQKASVKVTTPTRRGRAGQQIAHTLEVAVDAKNELAETYTLTDSAGKVKRGKVPREIRTGLKSDAKRRRDVARH